MRFIYKVLIVLLIVILIFVVNILVTTGFFRSIDSSFEDQVFKEISIKGAEDIMVSHQDSFALISATDRQFFPQDAQEEGGLYLIDLKDNEYTPIHLTSSFNKPFAPHGISFYKTDSTYRVMAINHVGDKHSIEIFNLNGINLEHIETLKHASMVSPNDIVMINEDQFYFTNDHKYTQGVMRLIEDYGGLAISNVIYCNGQDYLQVAEGIAYANGINYEKDRELLFVASPRGFLVKVYSRNSDGRLSFIEDIPCGTGVDNIEFDLDGNLWIGSHPNLLRFSAYARGKKKTSPSEIIKITYKAKGDYDIETVFLDKGSTMSGSTVAATFSDLIFTGNVMDDKFLILKKN